MKLDLAVPVAVGVLCLVVVGLVAVVMLGRNGERRERAERVLRILFRAE
ncbi:MULTISPECIES: hypothetical protein [Streptomyces]|nr:MULTISPECIES: hypothetical protein [Streptomyces]